MSFPRYESYKDSGIEWLGEVPGHWDVKRLKQICNIFPSNVDKKTYENESPVLLCNYTDVYYNEADYSAYRIHGCNRVSGSDQKIHSTER